MPHQLNRRDEYHKAKVDAEKTQQVVPGHIAPLWLAAQDGKNEADDDDTPSEKHIALATIPKYWVAITERANEELKAPKQADELGIRGDLKAFFVQQIRKHGKHERAVAFGCRLKHSHQGRREE